MCCFFAVTQQLRVILEAMCTLTGPPPGANMGMGMLNPDMMGMMQQHDLGMGFDLSQGGHALMHVTLLMIAICLQQDVKMLMTGFELSTQSTLYL